LTELDRKQDRAPVPKDWTYAPAPESRDIVTLRESYGHFIGGEWVEPTETYETIAPRDEETGRMVGMKPAGGIRQAKQAVQYLVQLHETLGVEWLTPDLYRLGASSLLNDVLMQLRKEKTGAYQSPDYFTVD